MREARVPGLAVALIRDGEIAWAEGFGVANTLTQRSVTSATVFEAASNGKVVAAYIALQLVEEGKLSFDAPLTPYLVGTSWMPSDAYRDRITLRHLLTHSAGFSNNMLLRPKRVAFAPGTRFRYAGVGFMVLQDVLEAVEQQPIEALAQARVFAPLGMTASSYVSPVPIRPRLANGHVSYMIGVLVFMVPFGLILVGVSAILAWLRSDPWGFGPGRRRQKRYGWILSAILASAFLTLLLFVVVIPAEEFRPWNLLGVGVLCTLSWVMLGSGIFFGGVWIAKRLGYPGARSDPWVPVWRGLWVVFSAAMPLALLGTCVVPVPNAWVSQGNVAYTLRTTAPDLARLLIALPDTLGRPQVKLNADISWGLGIGIQHSDEADALWHWGANTGYTSLMVMYPEHGLGIVILTNGDGGLSVARDIAQRALGGKAVWRVD
jgi:CubicO group peptidase (beta-lactamase class C family)